MKIKAVASLAACAAITFPLSAAATNGYQLIGVGAYQKSLGGAVTANPGSAMTAVSNPAGAARIGSRADFSMEAFMPNRSVDFTGMGGSKAESAVGMYGVPAIGWSAPVADGSNVYFGGGMFGTSGMGVDYASTYMTPNNGTLYWDGYSNISFWQMAPVVAMNINERLSLGASLNIDYQSAAFKQRAVTASGTVVNNVDLARGAAGFGYGISFGALYDVSKMLTLGLSYKSKQQFAPLEYQLSKGDITLEGVQKAAGTYTLDLDFPQQAAAGVAVHATPALTVSADVKWIDWSATMNKLVVNGPGVSFAMNTGWNDQTVYALGVAYKLNSRANLRAGYNYGKAPFDESKVSSNLILPAIVETHYTVGGDVKFNNHWELAFHYMYVPEKTMTAPSNDSQAPNAKISLSERSAGMNIGYRF